MSTYFSKNNEMLTLVSFQYGYQEKRCVHHIDSQYYSSIHAVVVRYLIDIVQYDKFSVYGQVL